MPIPVSCSCGRSLRVKDELTGRKIRCPGCKAVLAVPRLAVPDAEDEALDLLLADSPSEERVAAGPRPGQPAAAREEVTRTPAPPVDARADRAPRTNPVSRPSAS